MKRFILFIFMLAAGSTFLLSSCADDSSIPDTPLAGSDFGKVTTAVIVLNPVINEGSSTSIPSGATRKNVAVQVGLRPIVSTDVSGLAVVTDIPPGKQPLIFQNGSLPFEVVNPGELYDLVVSYTDTVAYTVPVIRYEITRGVISLKPGDDINAAASNDNAVLYLKEGTYTGDIHVTGENVMIFGNWDPLDGPTTILDGNLSFDGVSGKVRGLQVNKTISVNAPNFSAAFNNFNNAELRGDGMVLLRNKFTGPSVVVPASSAMLIDNMGIR